MTSSPDPRHEAYAGAITNHLPGNPEQVDEAVTAVMALADRDRQLAVWALQGLLTAFPADLTLEGPAVRSRLLPVGLVRRWQQAVCGQQAEPGRVMAAAALATLLGPIPDGVDSASQAAIRAIQLMNEAGQARDAAEARVRELEAALDRVRALADRLEEFAENALRTDDRDLYAAIARDLHAAIQPADQTTEK
jgi:hypothetical protein